MWIRDEMHLFVGGVRPIIYGYESDLKNAASSQLIQDIARDLIKHLTLGRWNVPSSTPLMFVAHSLGGLVLKDALVQLANSPNEFNHYILRNTLGAVMFGVPNFGMEQTHLLAVVKGQANETMIHDLSRNSNYVRTLDESFTGITFERDRLRFFWVYERALSSTVLVSSWKDHIGIISFDKCTNPHTQEREDGSLNRDGPQQLLVSDWSATRGLKETQPEMCFPINRNHSYMVKFDEGEHIAPLIYQEIASICGIKFVDNKNKDVAGSQPTKSSSSCLPGSTGISTMSAAPPSIAITMNLVIQSLDAPELNQRIRLIEGQYKGTMEWIFEYVPFTDWLQTDQGLFWINGKPGSGKSTLMKFIFEDSRTKRLLHNWTREAVEITAHFFFNYRGGYMEKSVEGLLRGLLKQTLVHNEWLVDLIRPVLEDSVKESKNSQQKPLSQDDLIEWTIPLLEKCLKIILGQKTQFLRLFLFFDALDEYDGNSKSIGGFLQDLIRLSTGSKTQVKICFSSRPWDVFKDTFGSQPSLSVQEHTRRDIASYCAGLLASAEFAPNYLTHTARDIVDRAQGVFLWVKLVVAELLEVIQSSKMEKPLDELQMIIQSLPQELDAYYEHIIQRIPKIDRFETYALLELVVRHYDANGPITLSYLLEALAVSECQTYPEAREKIERRRLSSFHTIQHDQSLIRSRTGGLLEVKKDFEDPFTLSSQEEFDGLKKPFVQLMHQTVFDFVTSLRFKSIVLGNEANITWENGHSLHTKYLWTDFRDHFWDHPGLGQWERRNDLLISHAKSAESTTGQSQYLFLRSLPDEVIHDTISYLSSPLDLSVLFSLILCVRDWVKDKIWHQGVQSSLLHLAIRGVPHLAFECIPNNDRLSTIKLLLENGYRLKGEPGIFQLVLSYISGADSTQNLLINEFLSFYQVKTEDDKKFMMEVGSILVNHGRDPNQKLTPSMLQTLPDLEGALNAPDTRPSASIRKKRPARWFWM